MTYRALVTLRERAKQNAFKLRVRIEKMGELSYVWNKHVIDLFIFC
jgi:hypothetical protein